MCEVTGTAVVGVACTGEWGRTIMRGGMGRHEDGLEERGGGPEEAAGEGRVAMLDTMGGVVWTDVFTSGSLSVSFAPATACACGCVCIHWQRTSGDIRNLQGHGRIFGLVLHNYACHSIHVTSL